jgi:hypothetical protein
MMPMDPPWPISSGTPDSRTSDEQLRDWLCRFTDVVVGTPTAKRVLLSSDEGTLFTDYTVRVLRWIRASQGTPASAVISVNGGVVQIGDRTLDAPDGEHPHLGIMAAFFAKGILPAAGLDAQGFVALETVPDAGTAGELSARSKEYVESLSRAAALPPCRSEQ